MKTSRFLIAGMLILALVSCDKEHGGQKKNETKSFLTLQFSVASPLTKTDNQNGVLDGTVQESSVSQAVIYLVQSGKVKDILSVNSLNQVSHAGYDDGYESSVLETTLAPGEYEVYAYAGVSSDPFGYSIDDSWSGDKIDTFTAESRNSVENASNSAASDNAFRMFNQHDASASGSTVPKVNITAANNTASNPAVSEVVYLDRLTAKITASQNSSFTISSSVKSGDFASAKASVDGVLPVSAALQMYVEQQWKDAGMTQLNTPATSRYGFLNDKFDNAVDPYATISYTGSTYNSVAVSDLSGRVVAAGDPLYVLENAAEATPIQGTTTGVVFKVTLDAKGDDSNITFFGYNKNSEHFLSLAALQAQYPNAFDVFGNKQPDGTDDDAANLSDAEALLASDVASFRAQTKINVFENGVMYYTFFVKDQNYNCYGIFRNTWYNLSVSEISNFGDDIPGGWDPDDPTVNPTTDTPVEDDKLFIKVKILVNKWVANTTNVVLGE